MRQPRFKNRLLAATLAAGLLSTGAIAGTAATVAAQNRPHQAAASNVVLTMESSPINSMTKDFNPFSTTSALYLVAGISFIYEPLIQFDDAKAGVTYPWLATKYAWSNGGKSLTFTIRQNVKWSNGEFLTPADVAFSYNLIRKNPAINTNGLSISSVTTSGSTVTLNFPSAQYTNFENIAGRVYIVPKSQWATVGNPATYVDATPVGTGPYVLGQFTPQGFTLVKNTAYWQQSKVQIGTLSFPAYASNTNAEEALFNGSLDWAGNFIPGLQGHFLNKSPYNSAWESPNSTVTLEPNLTRFPLNDVAVRQAISLAVDRTALSQQGEANLEPPATNASGLTLPLFNAYLTPAIAADKLSPTAKPSAAEKVLKADGWTMGSNGYFEKGGKTLSFSISDPTAYTDYAADATLIANELKKAGMDVTFNGESVTAWSADVQSGNFDSIIHWANGGTNPYSPYDGWFNSTLLKNGGDYEQLSNATLDAQLAQVAAAPTVAAESTALLPLENYMTKNVPLIPLLFGVAWSEVNGQQIAGWPTPQNPYETAQPATPTNEVDVLHLYPRS